MSLLAIIGGSGFSQLPGLTPLDSRAIATPYGETSARLTHGQLGGGEVLFLPRHGAGHHLPPHLVNYRANLWALRAAGASEVIALAAVGGIAPAYGPGVLAVPDQIIDYTYGRAHTLYDGSGTGLGAGVEHVDFTEPYCPVLRARLLAGARATGQPIVDGGTYGVTQGPRLESRAEVVRCARDGCDIVGMTGMPEAALARELGLNYACLAFVVNWAAGKGEAGITMDEIERNIACCRDAVLGVLREVAQAAGMAPKD